METLFNPDGKLMRFMTWVANMLILSLLWVVCCIPIVTIVPSTAAMYYVTLKMARQEDSGITKAFFRSFWSNLRQGIVLTVIFILIGAFLVSDYFACFLLPDNIEGYALWFIYIVAALFLMIVGHTYPLLAQFSNTIIGTLRNAFILSLTKLSYSIRLVIIQLAPLLLALMFPDAVPMMTPTCLLFLPGVSAWVCGRMMNELYAPMMDSMRSQEAAPKEPEPEAESASEAEDEATV